jgi:hypothetical protein
MRNKSLQQLAYALVPNDGSLEALIERKAKALATEIVLCASSKMKLGDQENTKERIGKAIEERTAVTKSEMTKALWSCYILEKIIWIQKGEVPPDLMD